MPHNQKLKLTLYLKQNTVVLSFLAVFSVVNIVYATNYYWAILFCCLVSTLFYYSARQFIKSQNPESGILIILSITILSLTFAQSIGHNAPIWLFHLIIIFQVLFLVSDLKHQLLLIALNVLTGMLTAFIQDQPMANIFSRGIVLILFSIYGYNTVKSLLKSAESLHAEIADKIRLNAKLLATRVFQRQVLDSTNYAIIAVNKEGIIIEFNKGAEQMLGYKADELLGKVTPMIFHDINEVEKRTEEINHKYNTNLNPGFETFVFKNRIGLTNISEWTYITKSKQPITVLLTINNIKDDNGEIKGYIGIAQNITQKKQQEENQQTAETIITNSPSVLFKWLPNEERSILYVSTNVLQVLGYNSVELTNNNSSYNILISTEDRSVLSNQIINARSSNANQIISEYKIEHKNKDLIWVEERTFIKKNNDGEVTFFEGIVTDITARKLAEIKLLESELRYELAIKSTAAGVWEWVNIEDGIVWWSSKYYELLGYQDQEIESSYEAFLEMLHPEDMPLFEETIKKHTEDNEPYMVEYRIRTKDGSYKWFLASGQTNRDNNGKPLKMVGSIIDIHHKKLNEELLIAREENFRTFIEAAKDLFFQTNPEGYFTYSNQAGLDLTGYTLDELTQKRYIEFVRDDYKENVIAFYNKQREDYIKLTYLEFPILTKDKRTVWLGQNVQLIIKDGIYTGSHVVARDVTMFKEIEQAKELAENKLEEQLATQKAVLESSSESIFAIDNKFCYTAYNQSHVSFIKQVYNYDISIGSTILNYLNLKNNPENEINNIKKALLGESFTIEEIYDVSDRQIYMQISYNPIVSENGKINGVAVFSQDISDKKINELALLKVKDDALQAASAKSDFLSNMSHEIRTPMNAIVGITELLMQRIEQPQNIEYLKSIKYSADNLLFIINDILDFSKIEAGKITLEQISFNLAEQLNELKKSFLHLAKEKGINLITKIDENIPKLIIGDSHRLNQILVNLIGNALKFTHTGIISIQIKVKEDRSDNCTLEFSVSDTGIGISKNKQKSIFESFNQAYSDTSRKFGGTGLGLAITKNLIELQGGKIWLVSDIGKGSTFYFELTFEKGNQSSNTLTLPKILAPSSSATSIVNRSLDGARILLVEDNSMNQFLATQILKKWNADVKLAENGLEALTILKNNSFDLVLMDLQMPEMSGYEATKHIRSGKDNIRNPKIPIIALTADAFEETKIKVLKTGMNDLITKPFKQDELFSKIVKHLPY
jgi:PAS domain S-box-containing protein